MELILPYVGPEFGLSLRASIAAAVVGNLLGALCTAFNATLSPKLGLRQIATSRYSFGFYGAKLCSLLNIIIGGGYGVVNYVSCGNISLVTNRTHTVQVVVGQILSAVSDYKMTITVGIIIIAILSYIISIFGFKIIHTFEKYSWIGTFILLLVLMGQAAPHIDPNVAAPDGNSGLGFAGAFLSILAINFCKSAAAKHESGN
jgi:purine-cytosine permease-like protein